MSEMNKSKVQEVLAAYNGGDYTQARKLASEALNFVSPETDYAKYVCITYIKHVSSIKERQAGDPELPTLFCNSLASIEELMLPLTTNSGAGKQAGTFYIMLAVAAIGRELYDEVEQLPTVYGKYLAKIERLAKINSAEGPHSSKFDPDSHPLRNYVACLCALVCVAEIFAGKNDVTTQNELLTFSKLVRDTPPFSEDRMTAIYNIPDQGIAMAAAV